MAETMKPAMPLTRAGSVAQTAPAVHTMTTEMIARLASILNVAQTLHTRLSSHFDQLFGSAPTPANKASEIKGPPSVISLIDDIEKELNDIRMQMNRADAQ